MCIHENVSSVAFQKLSREMKTKYGLIALTLVQYRPRGEDYNFTMFVNPAEPVCIRRAAHDLRTWHPTARGFSDQSANRLFEAAKDNNVEYTYPGDMLMIDGRNVPDSLDLDETNAAAVYQRCLENGYVNAESPKVGETAPVIATVAEASKGFLGTVFGWLKAPFSNAA